VTFQMNLMAQLALGSRAAAQTPESGAGMLWEFFNDILQRTDVDLGAYSSEGVHGALRQFDHDARRPCFAHQVRRPVRDHVCRSE
jgi:hypothetical protein